MFSHLISRTLFVIALPSPPSQKVSRGFLPVRLAGRLSTMRFSQKRNAGSFYDGVDFIASRSIYIICLEKPSAAEEIKN